MDKYRVLIADDHPLYRDALRNVVLEAFADVEVVECEDIASALECLERTGVDLMLLDIVLPDTEDLDGVRRLRDASPTCPMIVCSANDDPALVRAAFKLGVSGYLPKSSGTTITRHALQLVRGGGVYVPTEALGEAMTGATLPSPRLLLDGHPAEDATADLTPRQQAVLALLEQGMSNKVIARELGIGEITVKAHVSAILRKLGVDNRVQAVVAARTLRR
ncbi:response regulator transcription factor [Haliea sp. E1-2-M8]|uniref:LuxR C-terminal-related transcriptional regulator n=1 Tax=Haliea sp. E1-2-M8 TaxID=3064706 RepID=UPI002725F6F2|nr:response regulator transcription factor [Haliea sp. E1-2-M8]MDO8862648.1 response regulator transcription factor [Haliea sp. E1-2-M8]